MLLIQFLIVLFSLFAMTRAVRRFRRRTIGIGELALWVGFWAVVGVMALVPQVSQWFAKILGVGRGADAIFYVAVVGLSYAVFKLYLKTRDQDQEITTLVRRLALKEAREAGHDAPPR
ncbi:MAG: DUF2304 domain-containing protein [Gammaproteobacteria bacterium]